MLSNNAVERTGGHCGALCSQWIACSLARGAIPSRVEGTLGNYSPSTYMEHSRANNTFGRTVPSLRAAYLRSGIVIGRSTRSLASKEAPCQSPKSS
jgi:hypothetical protein